MADAQTVIQTTLAPVFLISGGTLFLTFAQSRLFRVLDRLRELGTRLREENDPLFRRELLGQRRRALRRAVILRNGVLFSVLVVALTVLSALLLLVPSVWPERDLDTWILLAFGGALASFFVALILLTWDSFLSVASARYASREFGDGLRPGEDDD